MLLHLLDFEWRVLEAVERILLQRPDPVDYLSCLKPQPGLTLTVAIDLPGNLSCVTAPDFDFVDSL